MNLKGAQFWWSKAISDACQPLWGVMASFLSTQHYLDCPKATCILWVISIT